MTPDLTAPTAEDQYFGIHLETLRLNAIVAFDLFLKRNSEYVLYRSARMPFTDKNREDLLENNISRLYVHASDDRAYYRYLESNLSEIISDRNIDESRRAGLVYDSAKFLVEELFQNPTLGENIRRSKDLVEATIDFILSSETAVRGLLQIMAYDYTTFTHSVNVCALSLALARKIGIDESGALNKIGMGALLHDIGKTKVAESILNKNGPLTPDEVFVVRRHPQWGCDLARQTDMIDPDSMTIILQHHEREDGSGYPGGVAGNHIHQFAKIVAIADAFDAMTTRRAWRPAMEAYPALQEMFAEKDAFNQRLLTEFTRMLGPSDESPEDAVDSE